MFSRKREPKVSAEERALLLGPGPDGKGTVFSKTVCSHCGGAHVRACPRVKSMTFDGSKITHVEFWPEGQWSDEHIIWPEDLYEEEEAT